MAVLRVLLKLVFRCSSLFLGKTQGTWKRILENFAAETGISWQDLEWSLGIPSA